LEISAVKNTSTFVTLRLFAAARTGSVMPVVVAVPVHRD
jgi:hypothetical protein